MGTIYYGVRHSDKVAVCLGKSYPPLLLKEPDYQVPSLQEVTDVITPSTRLENTVEYAKRIFDALTSFGKVEALVRDSHNFATEDGIECENHMLTHSVYENDEDVGKPLGAY